MTSTRIDSLRADCRRDDDPGLIRAGWLWAKAKLYGRLVHKGLTKAFDNCGCQEDFVLGEDRLVIFSDHHKGTRDGADDFWVAERAYRAALAYYRAAGFGLMILGDAEELWENSSTDEVMKCYRDVLDLELKFLETRGGRGLWRFFGNHDLQWKKQGRLGRHLGVDIKVCESLKLRMVRKGVPEPEGLLFLAHGHQGTVFSDLLPEVALPVVRYVWAPWQRLRKQSLNKPSRDYNLRETHESAMAAWAEQPRTSGERVVLIAGHTHRPIFGGRHQPAPEGPSAAQQEPDQASQGTIPTEEVPSLAAGAERARANKRYYLNPEAIDPPCFFNTGCCSFSDGDVTGIELDCDEIRLVRWTKAPHNLPECLQCLPLSPVLAAVGDGAPMGEGECATPCPTSS